MERLRKSESKVGVVLDLANLPPDALIDRAALARMLARCEASIDRAVKRGEIPKPVKFMGKKTWTAKVIQDHFVKRLALAAQEQERAAQDRERLVSKIHALQP